MNRKQILFKYLFLLHTEEKGCLTWNWALFLSSLPWPHKRRNISNSLILLMFWPHALIFRARYATHWCQWWTSTWFQACEVRAFHMCETGAELHHSGPQTCRLFSTWVPGISETCSYSKRKARVLVYAGPYLIAVLHPFLLSMSAICMKANTN